MGKEKADWYWGGCYPSLRGRGFNPSWGRWPVTADQGLAAALDSLDARSRHIVQARWLSEGESATLHELAAEYGISAERVRQIEAKALKKMRELIPA